MLYSIMVINPLAYNFNLNTFNECQGRLVTVPENELELLRNFRNWLCLLSSIRWQIVKNLKYVRHAAQIIDGSQNIYFMID